jgi:hypothetical protein
MIEEEFHVVAHCPQCGVPAEAWPSDMTISNLAAETVREEAAEATIDLDCETCGNTFAVTIRANVGEWEVFLTDDPSKMGTFEHYSYDDWINDIAPEPHPRAIFDKAIGEWAHLLDTIADKKSGSAGTNRMLLVQLFSIVEAYLSDAIIKLVHEEPGVTAAVVQWHPDLKDEQISLKRVATEPDIVRDMVVAQLRKTQFHRFEFVNGMLRAAIDHHLLPAQKDRRDMVLKSVQLRHDCAHRNGRDQEGNILDILTTQYLSELAGYFMDIIAALANRIDEIQTDRKKAMLDDLNEVNAFRDDS